MNTVLWVHTTCIFCMSKPCFEKATNHLKPVLPAFKNSGSGPCDSHIMGDKSLKSRNRRIMNISRSLRRPQGVTYSTEKIRYAINCEYLRDEVIFTHVGLKSVALLPQHPKNSHRNISAPYKFRWTEVRFV